MACQNLPLKSIFMKAYRVLHYTVYCTFLVRALDMADRPVPVGMLKEARDRLARQSSPEGNLNRVS